MTEHDVAVTREVYVREPFEALYVREQARLVRAATSMVDDPGQAEEIVQEAFAALYRRYGNVADPSAYVRSCVFNGCRKALRRRRLVRRQPAPVAPEDGSLGFNHVLDAVHRLPARQRAAVVLRYDLQLTEAEIADTLQIPLGTVKSTLHRAIARLRQEVQP